jgi:hypothetical protein
VVRYAIQSVLASKVKSIKVAMDGIRRRSAPAGAITSIATSADSRAQLSSNGIRRSGGSFSVIQPF